MRAFNRNERKYIEILSKLNENYISTCSKFLQDNFFTIDRGIVLTLYHPEKAVLFFLKPETWLNDKETGKCYYEFLEVISLLNYLNQERLILIIPDSKNAMPIQILFSNFNSKNPGNGDKVILNENGDYLDRKNPHIIKNSTDKIIYFGQTIFSSYYEYISATLTGIILPTEELKELVRHNFKSEEDRKFAKNLNVAWVGILVAILMGLIGIWNPFTNSYKIEQKNHKIKSQTSKYDSTQNSGIESQNK